MVLLGHRLQDEGKVEGPGHPGVPREYGGGPIPFCHGLAPQHS